MPAKGEKRGASWGEVRGRSGGRGRARGRGRAATMSTGNYQTEGVPGLSPRVSSSSNEQKINDAACGGIGRGKYKQVAAGLQESRNPGHSQKQGNFGSASSRGRGQGQARGRGRGATRATSTSKGQTEGVPEARPLPSPSSHQTVGPAVPPGIPVASSGGVHGPPQASARPKKGESVKPVTQNRIDISTPTGFGNYDQATKTKAPTTSHTTGKDSELTGFQADLTLEQDVFNIMMKEKHTHIQEIQAKYQVEITATPVEESTEGRVGVSFGSCQERRYIQQAIDEYYGVYQETKHESHMIPAGYKLGTLDVYIHACNITNLQVDGIVNAANGGLYHAGGVAKAIADNAGRELIAESRRLVKENGRDFETTDVIRTTAGRLPCGVVLHAVGPIWPRPGPKSTTDAQKARERDCVQLLRETFRNILWFSEMMGLNSIAIPPVSSGIFGVPHEHVVAEMVHAIFFFNNEFPQSSLKHIHIVDLGEAIIARVSAKLRGLTPCLPFEEILNILFICCDQTTHVNACKRNWRCEPSIPWSYLGNQVEPAQEAFQALERGTNDVMQDNKKPMGTGHRMEAPLQEREQRSPNNKAAGKKRHVAASTENELAETFKKKCDIQQAGSSQAENAKQSTNNQSSTKNVTTVKNNNSRRSGKRKGHNSGKSRNSSTNIANPAASHLLITVNKKSSRTVELMEEDTAEKGDTTENQPVTGTKTAEDATEEKLQTTEDKKQNQSQTKQGKTDITEDKTQNRPNTVKGETEKGATKGDKTENQTKTADGNIEKKPKTTENKTHNKSKTTEGKTGNKTKTTETKTNNNSTTAEGTTGKKSSNTQDKTLNLSQTTEDPIENKSQTRNNVTENKSQITKDKSENDDHKNGDIPTSKSEETSAAQLQ